MLKRHVVLGALTVALLGIYSVGDAKETKKQEIKLDGIKCLFCKMDVDKDVFCGHAGGQIGWLHFGLGKATSVEVRVEWAGSGWGPWIKLDANGYATITQGSTQAQIWRPKGER